VVVAPAPDRVPGLDPGIDGGMATEALIAHVVVSKFCDSLPLYWQAQMLGRQSLPPRRRGASRWIARR
jgi:transposase